MSFVDTPLWLPDTPESPWTAGAWDSLKPAVWQAVAAPDRSAVLPSRSTLVAAQQVFVARVSETAGGSSISDHVSGCAIGLWSAVLDLMLYSLGWRDPAAGVVRWVEQGLPTDDRRLAVVAHLIGPDTRSAAADLAAFLLLKGGRPIRTFGQGRLGQVPDDPPAAPPVDAIPKWVLEAYARPRIAPDWSEFLPGSGENDSMHLTLHCWNPIAETARRVGLLSDASDSEDYRHAFYSTVEEGRGSAILFVQHYLGWYETLVRRGDALEPLDGERSWRIDVVCASIGWLGTFRKSRQTGRWFAGPHSLHEWGEPPTRWH